MPKIVVEWRRKTGIEEMAQTWEMLARERTKRIEKTPKKTPQG